MTPRDVQRTVRLLIAAVAGALLLAACSTPLPAPRPDPVPAVPPPVLTDAQVSTVLSSVGAALAQGDAKLDAGLFDGRVSGPALAIRKAEYTVNKAIKKNEPLIELPTVAQTVALTTTETWPRSFLVVTEQPEDLQAPRLLLLTQSSARANYTLWGWARLLPGVQMPAMLSPQKGSAFVALDTKALKVAPGAIAERYADVLAKGKKSSYADLFAADTFREKIAAARELYAKIAKQAGRKLTETYTPDEDSITALATADGGAIVVARMKTETRFASGDRPLKLAAAEAALLGKATVDKSATLTWTDVVAFYVPPAAAGGDVQVLAAEHARTKVDGS